MPEPAILRDASALHGPGATRDPKAKVQHIDVCLGDAVEYHKTTGFERFDFVNNALPETSLQGLDISTRFLGKRLQAPLMIAPMTGGTERGAAINRVLARAAERWQIPMGVGSQRLAVEDGSRARYYTLRDSAPTTMLFANFGGAQLARGWGAKEAHRAMAMLNADALFVHLNPIQEAIQGGDQDFRGLQVRLQRLCASLAADQLPVLAREVCFGMSHDTCARLQDCGVAGIDCAGAGGTSWAKVEALCARQPRRRIMGERFGEWGIPTSESVINARAACPTLPLIATGGIRNGVDLAKALALGADLGAMARPFLLKAHEGEEALNAFIEQTLDELRICMFGVGAKNLSGLRGMLQSTAAANAGSAGGP
jgi:isopentenyl-diphosphate delta-isomerase